MAQDYEVDDPERAAPRWAALVEDKLVPMPRRRLAAADVLFQASAPAGVTLVRDYNSPSDVGFAPTAVIDLAEGNVFLLVQGGPRHADPDRPRSRSSWWCSTTDGRS